MSNQPSAITNQQSERVATGRLWWIGLLAVVASVAANTIIGLLAAGERAPFPGVSIQSVGTLMFMHVVTAAICVGLLGGKKE
jgi:hypothetical protein